MLSRHSSLLSGSLQGGLSESVESGGSGGSGAPKFHHLQLFATQRIEVLEPWHSFGSPFVSVS